MDVVSGNDVYARILVSEADSFRLDDTSFLAIDKKEGVIPWVQH